ncbi:Spaetzle [Trinorchestia longiramus]|nr:Spaetzle [Trinorchestia longiramus]
MAAYRVTGIVWVLLSVLLSGVAAVAELHSATPGPGVEDQATADGSGFNTEVPDDMPVAQAFVASDTAEGEDGLDISPAEELRIAAQKAGYNITDMTLDLATHGTEEELTEILPQPLAAALIQRRRRPDLRERLIGMTFLGQPVPLDRVSRRPFMPDNRNNRRRSGSGPIRRIPPRFAQGRTDFISSEASTRPRLLKPVSLPASRAQIIFPPRPGRPDDSSIARHRPQDGAPVGFQLHESGNELSIFTKNNKLGFDGSHSRPFGHSQRPQNKPFDVFDLREHPIPNIKIRPQRPLQDFPPIKDDFDNSLGPDFGPVIYETDPTIQSLIPNPFQSFETDKTSSKIPSPFESFHSSGPQTPSRPSRPKQFVPSKPFSTGFTSSTGSSHSGSGSGSNFKRDRKSQCTQYTETICLDADNYPHAEILSSLEGDKGRTNVLIAEVRNQSADNLVDGITARQEEKYNYSHYFGSKPDSRDRRQDNDVHRDFADEGGYLCPSEVKYARPKRARNSKGEWKFVVNMEKYTQTIRMEKCIKPGGACSYVSHHYHATCSQVHNYQRLLSWEKKRGLHMDIFKVPSCCTCHIQGYSYAFPPLNQNKGRQSPSDSQQLESRLTEDRALPSLPTRGPGVVRDDRLPNRNVKDYSPPKDHVGATISPNGGPFTRLPAGKRPAHFERLPQRINRSRRPGASTPSAGVRRMDISGSYESRHEIVAPSNFGPIGGGGLDISRPNEDPRLQQEVSRGLQSSGDLRIYRDRATDVNHRSRGSNLQSFSSGRQSGGRNKENMGVSRHGAVNYDYHPILQFFDGYQK